MVAEESKSQKVTDKTPAGVPTLFDVLSASELLWQPYRSMTQALLKTHQNLAAFMAVNRGLTDEMQAIIRRSQQTAIETSEKMLGRISAASKSPMSTSDVDEIYDLALSGIRELGEATVAAQLRSIEALRDHAKMAMKAAAEAPTPRPKS